MSSPSPSLAATAASLHSGSAPPPAASAAVAADVTPAERAWNLLQGPGDLAQRRERAAAVLARHHWKGLVRSAQYRFHLSHHDAQDAVQNTFLRFLERTPEDCAVPEAYLSIVFARCCIDVLRRQRRETDWLRLDDTDGDDEPPVQLAAPMQTTDPAHLLKCKRVLEAVLEALVAQTQARRDVLEGMAEGLSDRDIAARLGISEAAVGDRKHRLRAVLRPIIEELI